MKVPWPVSDREAVLHYFEIEYFKEDLILVLIKTISDLEHIEADTHGFSGDGIPQAKDTIRIDLVGGFVLQKVGSNRCYFRAIFNFDIKLEFIPASLINFMSRQLLGNGHQLYQKAVGSVATTDEDYQSALRGPLYVRVRQEEKEEPAFRLDEHKVGASAKDNVIKTRTSISEITEEDDEPRAEAEGKNHTANNLSGNLVADKQWKGSIISPEVEQALDVLDQVISLVRARSIGGKIRGEHSSVGDDFPISELVAKASFFNDGAVPESGNNKLKLNKSEGSPYTDDHRQNDTSSSIIEEAGHNPVGLTSQKERFPGFDELKMTELKTNLHESLPSKASVRLMQLSTPDSTCKVSDEEESLKANGFYNSGAPSSSGKTETEKKRKKKKKFSLGCLLPSFVWD